MYRNACFPLEDLRKTPNLVVSTDSGEIFDIPELAAIARTGKSETIPEGDEWISLPHGSDLYLLPQRAPVGYHRKTGERIVVHHYEGVPVTAVAAFVAPAHTILYHAAYQKDNDADCLPLFAYSAVAWKKGRFVVPAVRVDRDLRQDLSQFDLERLPERANAMMDRYPANRLARHLMENCVLTYGCPAARNFALERWEMPLPTSRSCNSRCLGCISLQTSGVCPSTQNRIEFVPTVEEIVEIAVPHLEQAPRAIASFGQGCEGEPLTNPELLEQSIRAIREKTSRGTIHLNTNGSYPDVVRSLFRAGLDSIRVSLNSFREPLYNAYFRPGNYAFADVLKSLAIAREEGKWASVNYLVFPGVTDQESELRCLLETVVDTGLAMIQWRNLNIDPDLYLGLFRQEDIADSLGMKWLIKKVHTHFPKVRKGYYNPSIH